MLCSCVYLHLCGGECVFVFLCVCSVAVVYLCSGVAMYYSCVVT